MDPTIRSALVLLAGVVVAVIVVTLMDTMAGRTPTAAVLIVLAGWVLAAGAGSYVATRLATRSRPIHGLIVALFVLVATVGNLAAIPHPVWLWPAAIILIPAAGWAATKLVIRSDSRI